jgi:hypothetical protein
MHYSLVEDVVFFYNPGVAFGGGKSDVVASVSPRHGLCFLFLYVYFFFLVVYILNVF